MAQVTVEVRGDATTIEAKQKALQTLGKLDVNVLQKLADLSGNQKAVNMLMSPPPMLKTFLQI